MGLEVVEIGVDEDGERGFGFGVWSGCGGWMGRTGRGGCGAAGGGMAGEEGGVADAGDEGEGVGLREGAVPV